MGDSEFVYMEEDGLLKTAGHNHRRNNLPLNPQIEGHTYNMDPGDLGVPDGAIVWLKMWVYYGNDNQSPQGFLYHKGNHHIAVYSFSGDNSQNNLKLEGIFGVVNGQEVEIQKVAAE